MNITLIARNENKLLNVLNELDKSKGQLTFICLIDFADTEKLKEKVNLLKGIYHILINNTGGPSGIGPIIDAKTKSFEDAFSIHLVNNQILVQKVIDGMKSEGYGRIVNVISTSVAPIPGLGVSNTIRSLNSAKTLSIELGSYGITVNNVLPGFTNTNRLKSLITKKKESQGKTEEEIVDLMKSTVPAKIWNSK